MKNELEKCVVVIPVHKPNPDLYEQISFQQCIKILSRFPIYLIAPEGMNVEIYQTISPKLNIKWVNPYWLSTLLNYNKLKLSNYFYNQFKGHKYLLTYELDAFIFEDQVDYWCTQGFDFIGAPWFEGWANPGEHLSGVGNSGFSIRNIAALKRGIKSIYYYDPSRPEAFSENRYVRYFKKRLQLIKNHFLPENPTLQNATLLNEDWIISELMGKKINNFKIASIDEALKFSFEVKPEKMFEMNNRQLPMGCHAWWKYNLTFWKPYIENLGYQL